MSYHSLRLNSIDNEKHLLTEIAHLQDRIRRGEENTHNLKVAEEKHYTKVFRPITTSLSNLKKASLSNVVGNVHNAGNDDDDSDDGGADVEEEAKIKLEPGESLYSAALSSIPKKDRDDGVLGLNVAAKKIGDYKWRVDRDTLYIINDKEQVRSKKIENYDLWRLLLSQTPKNITVKNRRGKNTAAVGAYRALANDLHLVESALKRIPLARLKTRHKYPLLVAGSAVGSGFLFTSKKPKFLNKRGGGSSSIRKRRRGRLVHPSVVLIPSNKKRLLRELLKGVAELRSGNTSMRNVVVPLAQEAKRRKILPPGLLTNREMAWVYA